MTMPASRHDAVRKWLFDHMLEFQATNTQSSPYKSAYLCAAKAQISVEELDEAIASAEGENLIAHVNKGAGVAGFGGLQFTDGGYAIARR